jgi:hypothetical protein
VAAALPLAVPDTLDTPLLSVVAAEMVLFVSPMLPVWKVFDDAFIALFSTLLETTPVLMPTASVAASFTGFSGPGSEPMAEEALLPVAEAPIRLPPVICDIGVGVAEVPMEVVPTTAPLTVAPTSFELVCWSGMPADTPATAPCSKVSTEVVAACAPLAISTMATAEPMPLRLNMGARAARLWILRAFMA